MKKLIYSKEDLDLILTLELEEKDKEIEILNKELKQEKKDFKEANDKCFELISENKRLNNIINEFEKYLIEEIEYYKKRIKFYKNNKDLRSGILDLVGEYEGEKVCFEDTLCKLQELKGSEKE